MIAIKVTNTTSAAIPIQKIISCVRVHHVENIVAGGRPAAQDGVDVLVLGIDGKPTLSAAAQTPTIS